MGTLNEVLEHSDQKPTGLTSFLTLRATPWMCTTEGNQYIRCLWKLFLSSENSLVSFAGVLHDVTQRSPKRCVTSLQRRLGIPLPRAQTGGNQLHATIIAERTTENWFSVMMKD